MLEHAYSKHLMTTTTETKPWDFSHVLDFVNANAFTPTANVNAAAATALPPPATGESSPRAPGLHTDRPKAADKFDDDSSFDTGALGNFSKVWQFLGVPKPSPATTPHDGPTPDVPSNKIDYASDGAVYKSKNTGYVVIQQAEETATEESDSATLAATPLTKSQRKRASRKERKAAQAILPFASGVVSESEADQVARRNPAKKASAHIVRSATPSQPQQQDEKAVETERKAVNKSTTSTLVKNYELQPNTTPLHNSNTERQNQKDSLLNGEKSRLAIEAVAKATAALKQQKITPENPFPGSRPGNSVASTVVQKQQQGSSSTVISAPVPAKVLLTPASLLPPQNVSTPKQPQKQVLVTPETAPNQVNFTLDLAANGAVNQLTVPSSAPSRKKPPSAIEPHIIRSGEERHWALFLNILNTFPEDRRYLVSPMNMTTHNNHPDGIHVFVDASNIFLGFMDQLKRARGIHHMHHMPQANLSFDGLALLMERRRPVAKRTLVGSTPHLPAFDKAAAVGYDCSILEKVHKSRQLTERQVYFRESDARRSGRAPKFIKGPLLPVANGSPAPVLGSGPGASGSETNAAFFDPPRWGEQGVDEILHLKMAQSIIDAERPSTMVLATGDAAAAEYSDGFGAMVERALRKGWKVELVSWSNSINSMYRNTLTKGVWGDQFKIIYLDFYAEELLEMDLDSA